MVYNLVMINIIIGALLFLVFGWWGIIIVIIIISFLALLDND